jgi:uncharacterized membrane protein YedE/YeeE
VTGVLILTVSALCGVAFGYAAQRGSLCVVSGIESLLAGRSPRVFLSFLRCSVWVLAISLPLAWCLAGDQLDTIARPTLIGLGGALLFGIGAAVNGGCSFGTLIRLGGGDASFVATLAGLGFGFVVQQRFPALDPMLASLGPTPLERPTLLTALALAAAATFCVRELIRERRRDNLDRRWPPERAAILMGVAGGVLYALHGSWAYTVAIERGLAAMTADDIPNLDLALIFLSCLAGAAIAARRLHRFALRLNARDIPRHLLGGTIMGTGAALIPGGNDVLVLHALPALSPHALFAYAALVAGAAAALAVGGWMRRVGRAAETST